MAKKIDMTPETKDKLIRSIPSVMKPYKITIESDDEIDNVFEIKLPTNIQYLKILSTLEKLNASSTQTEQLLAMAEATLDYLVPNIVSWKYGDEDYSDNVNDFIQYVRPTLLISLFTKIQEIYI